MRQSTTDGQPFLMAAIVTACAASCIAGRWARRRRKHTPPSEFQFRPRRRLNCRRRDLLQNVGWSLKERRSLHARPLPRPERFPPEIIPLRLPPQRRSRIARRTASRRAD
jgi:hypothetical protein